NIRWAMTATAEANWHPLTWLSHMADCTLFGLNPRGHHLTSLLFHLANTLLLFILFARLTSAPWRSALVAALFAVHPLHVESVAWVAERKDVLSTFFWFLTMLAYAAYAAKPGAVRYGATLLLFALGLMAKPMLVTLPCVLLLLDAWPLGRFHPAGEGRERWATIGRRVAEKLPFFLLSAISSVITFQVQRQGHSMDVLIPLRDRLMNAFAAYATYLGKLFWPAKLAVLYPFSFAVPLWQGVTACLLLLLVTTAAFVLWRRFPWLAVGWLWYVGTLVPVIGVVKVGSQAIADRYTYVPYVGLFIIIAWGGEALTARWRGRELWLGAAAGGVVIALAAASWNYARVWRDSTTLFSHAVQVTRNNYVAFYNLGMANLDRKSYAEAEGFFRESLRINPLQPQAYDALGNALSGQERYAEAVKEYEQAIRISHDFADAFINLGRVQVKLGMAETAAENFRKAIDIRPDDPEAHHRLGVLLAEEGRLAEAAHHFGEVVRLRPTDAKGYYNLGLALMQSKRYAEAQERFVEALRLRPDFGPARASLEECRNRSADSR
ncbi:MAG TPA: tetratricopeptide repeat protein, partial [Geobacteraceae bacterium]